MKRVRFTYRLRFSFTEEVWEHRFTLKCLPDKGARQQLVRMKYRVEPASFVQEGVDSFGNRYLYGCAHEEHREFTAEVEGVALCGMAPREPAGEAHRLAAYRVPTRLTKAGPRLKAFIASVGANAARDTRAYVEAIRIALHEKMIYERWHTDVATTAEEAFAGGYGVCQDYVHIFLACLRARGIACRYVAGIVPGEGETHAWADVLIGDSWYGFDPTNACPAGDDYLTLCRGRDAYDCRINRGIFMSKGGAMQTTCISAILNEDKEQ